MKKFHMLNWIMDVNNIYEPYIHTNSIEHTSVGLTHAHPINTDIIIHER